MRSKVRASKFSKIWLCLFFGIFAIAGLVTAYFISYLPLKNINEAQSWIIYPAEITSSQVVSSTSDGSTTYRAQIDYQYVYKGIEYTGDRYDFMKVSSSGYQSKQEIVDANPVGKTINIYLDPNDPSQSVIHRDPGWMFLFTLFPLPFLAVGFGGIYFTLRKKTDKLPDKQTEIVDTGHMTLKPRYSPLMKFIVILFAAGFWNGIVSVFLMEEGISLFLSIFVVIGIVLMIAVLYQFLNLFNPRVTLIVDSSHLTSGGEYWLEFKIIGNHRRLKNVIVKLIAKEIVHYRRGTRTYTDKHTILEKDIYNRPGGRRSQDGCKLQIPGDVMPSFKASNNQIEWYLDVCGSINFWPDMMSEYPITIFPSKA